MKNNLLYDPLSEKYLMPTFSKKGDKNVTQSQFMYILDINSKLTNVSGIGPSTELWD